MSSLVNESSGKVTILQHVPQEGAGTTLTFLEAEKIPHTTLHLWKADYTLPNLDTTLALVVMGGPMNVYEEEKYPFLRKENDFIQAAVKRNIPYLGICLGAQLLAKALGARVYKAARPEIGWDVVNLSPTANAHGLFAGLNQKSLTVLQWHEDTFDLPQGAVRLASSKAVGNQAFGFRNLFYGLQFHVEVDRGMLERWFKGHPSLKSILSDYDKHRSILNQTAKRLCQNFSNLIRFSLAESTSGQ